MIDTIIVSGGNIHSDFALDFLKKNEACLIAADKGLEFFLEHQLLPDAVIGDFDSLSEDGKKFLEIQEERSMDSEIPYGGMTEWKLQKGFGNEKKEIKVIRLRPEKDDSDTQSAMNYAIRTGAKKIVIFGVTGNRVDHLMANFGLLVLAQNQGAEVTLVDQYNYMKLISDGTVLKKSEQFGKYVSFFPFGGNVTDLTLEGFKYPLSNYCLTAADSGLTAVSYTHLDVYKRQVDARDISQYKVDMIEENIHRTDCINVQAHVMDATVFDVDSELKADVVLADVPCSGYGVIGKKPEIKYRVTAQKQEEIVILQRTILDNAAEYVKPGGVLVFSTCTIAKEENEENMLWFMNNHPFKLESIDPYLPEELHSETTALGYLQLLPGVHKTDGFFIAKFRRK